VPLFDSLRGWLQMIAHSENALSSTQAHALTTIELPHCKPIANRSLLKYQAGGVVGKCRQLKIRFARHFGQARGLARRKEKSPSGL
jgi:hypothetical protein